MLFSVCKYFQDFASITQYGIGVIQFRKSSKAQNKIRFLTFNGPSMRVTKMKII